MKLTNIFVTDLVNLTPLKDPFGLKCTLGLYPRRWPL